MGIAFTTFNFYIRNENLIVLAEGLLRSLNEQCLQAKSVEIHVPGRRFEKLKGSVDGDLFVKDGLPARLPGEKLVRGTGFTTLERPDEFLTIPRDLPRIIERLGAASNEVNHLCQSTKDADSVYWTFWGLCKLKARFGDSSREGYFLRQSLYRGEIRQPLLRVSSDLVQNPTPEFIFRLKISSFAWSNYTSDFDPVTQNWVPKPHSTIQSENARLLAQSISQFVQRYPDAEIEWDMEHDHQPDLGGYLPYEFEALFGVQNSPQLVKNLLAR